MTEWHTPGGILSCSVSVLNQVFGFFLFGQEPFVHRLLPAIGEDFDEKCAGEERDEEQDANDDGAPCDSPPCILLPKPAVDDVGDGKEEEHGEKEDDKKTGVVGHVDGIARQFMVDDVVDDDKKDGEHESAQIDHSCSPYRSPPAIAKQLLVGHDNPDGDERAGRRNEVAQQRENEQQYRHEDLDEEALWQGVACVARRQPEQNPSGYQQEHSGDEHTPVAMFFVPVGEGVEQGERTHFLVLFKQALHGFVGQNVVLQQHKEEGADEQHLDGRKRHLAPSADVVADEVAGSPQQLPERVEQRASAHAPDVQKLLPRAFPSDGAVCGFLSAVGAEVALERVAAVEAAVLLIVLERVVEGVEFPLPVSFPLFFQLLDDFHFFPN